MRRSSYHYLILRFWMLHVVKNTEDNFEDVIPPMRQERIPISLQYFKHYSEAPVHRQPMSSMKHAPYSTLICQHLPSFNFIWRRHASTNSVTVTIMPLHSETPLLCPLTASLFHCLKQIMSLCPVLWMGDHTFLVFISKTNYPAWWQLHKVVIQQQTHLESNQQPISIMNLLMNHTVAPQHLPTVPFLVKY